MLGKNLYKAPKNRYKASENRYTAAKSRYNAAEKSNKAPKNRYKADVKGNKQGKKRYNAAESSNKKPLVGQQRTGAWQQGRQICLQRRSKALQANVWLLQLGRILVQNIHISYRSHSWPTLST